MGFHKCMLVSWTILYHLWYCVLQSSLTAPQIPSVLPVHAFLPHPRLLPTTDLFMVSIQFSSATQSYPTLCNPMDCSTPGLSVHHQLLEFTQTHVQRVGDAIQPSHPLLSPSPPAFNLSPHQGLFQGVSSSHQVAKGLEFQHQSFQWAPRADLL